MSITKCAAVLGVVLAMGGCGSFKVTPRETPASQGQPMVEDTDLGKVYLAANFNFRGYETLVVGDIKPGTAVPLKDVDPETMGIYFRSALVKRLAAIGVFDRVTDDKSVLAGGQGKLLLLEGSFSELDPGNRALRLLSSGYGAGRTKVQVEMEVKDPKDKRVLFSASDRRVGPAGYAGGDTEGLILDSLDKMADGYAAFIRRVAGDGKK